MIHTLHTILLLVYILVCCVLTVIVLMQEGQAGRTYPERSAAPAETYWGKNKGRSMEGGLELATRILAVVFVVLSLILNLKIFQ